MYRIQRSWPADRHTDAMYRYLIVAPDRLQSAMRRATSAHIVFGMDFEKTRLLSLCNDRGEVPRLKAGAGQSMDRRGRKTERHGRGRGGSGHRIHVVAPLSLPSARAKSA